jgi:hypothetical protein
VRGVWNEARVRLILRPLTAGIVLAYFLFFTWHSLFLYFDSDDMLNLYFAWTKPWAQIMQAQAQFWSGFYRPMGALFYRGIFAVAGFNPLPFRVACLLLGIANIALCGWFVRMVAGSERVVALAVLLFAFHPRLLEVWYRTAVIYDLLCFTFLYLAACLYIAARRNGAAPGPGRVIAILTCYICALNTKEMAVSLPVILLAWELLYHYKARLKRLWLIACLAAMNLPYIYGKTHGAGLLTGNPDYTPKYTWSQFAGAWKVYLQFVLLREDLRPAAAIGILAALLLIALAARSRPLILAWTIIFFGTLPVCFIAYRGGYAVYISWVGWVLYAAVTLSALQDLVLRGHSQYRTALACLVFLFVGWRSGKISLHEQRTDPRHWLYDPPAMIRSMTAQMKALQPTFPPRARMLFVEDSFPTSEWTPFFIMKLAWQDDTLTVDRVKMMEQKPVGWSHYSYVFTYEDGAYRRLKP